MLSRRTCLHLVSASIIFPSLILLKDGVLAAGVGPLGFDTLYKKISTDGKSELICYTEVDLGEMVSEGRATTVLADVITISGLIRRPGLDLTLLARSIICGEGAQIDVSGPSPARSSPKARNGYNAGDNGANGGLDAEGKPVTILGVRGGNVVISAGTISGTLLIQSNGGNGGDAESGGDGAKGATGQTWTTSSQAGDGKRGGAAGKAGTPGDGGSGGLVAVNTLDETFTAVTATIRGGGSGHPGMNGKPGDPGDPGKGGSGDIVVPCHPTMICSGSI